MPEHHEQQQLLTEKLKENQEEMKACTEFLRTKYFLVK